MELDDGNSYENFTNSTDDIRVGALSVLEYVDKSNLQKCELTIGYFLVITESDKFELIVCAIFRLSS